MLRALGAAAPAVVLLSASTERAAEAFDAGATDYLVWPVAEERFALAMERAERRVTLERLSGLRAQLLYVLGAGAEPSEPEPAEDDRPLERIAIELKGKLRVVPVAEIDYVTSSGPYAELHVGDRHHLIRASMQDLERRLDPARFVRIHRSIIVRLDQVDTLLKGGGGEYEVLLRTGARLRVSRARREALERRLGVLGPPADRVEE
ncbi:MAG TPA: LytTR family DNA-binding domain-containing protein [Gemmatimonadaceae bacterium]|nr:LytTR family DNA-binding domain-containing protein [Gemmatimonadaceae bacterium]